MTFEDLKIEFKKNGIIFKSKKDWEIFIPFLCGDDIRNIIMICRENLIIDWHIIFGEITDECQEPDVKIYWDRTE